MKDITNYKSVLSNYGGSELKRTFFIDDEKYMVKFPNPIKSKSKTISYIKNQ